jgi:hypothetical protein
MHVEGGHSLPVPGRSVPSNFGAVRIPAACRKSSSLKAGCKVQKPNETEGGKLSILLAACHVSGLWNQRPPFGFLPAPILIYEEKRDTQLCKQRATVTGSWARRLYGPTCALYGTPE